MSHHDHVLESMIALWLLVHEEELKELSQTSVAKEPFLP
jgi:hypothetical protein